MEDQQNSERSDHLDEIGLDPAIELIRSMPLYSPSREPWCTDPLLESFHSPYYHHTFYSSISATVVSSPPDFDGVFSDGLHGINTTSSMSLSYSRTGSYDSEMVITLEVLQQQFGKPLGDAAQSFGVTRSTFKRVCRRNGIHRWPRCKKVKKECSFNPNLVTGSVECVEGAIGPTSLSTHSIPGVVERSQRNSPSCKHSEHLEEKNISPACETTSTDGQADIGNQFLGSSLSSHEGVLQEQNEFLPGSNKSKMIYGSEEENINICQGSYDSEMVITLEVLQQQFGKPLVDAAQSFGVTRSTFKRVCRRNGIYWWPSPKKVKKKCSFNPNLVTGSVECLEGAIGPTSLSTHSIRSVVERSQRNSPSCKHSEHLEENNISPACETTSSDGQADIGNQFLGSSLSSHEGVLQEQNEFLPGSNKSKMVYGSEEDNINVCHGNDPAANLCGSSNHIDSLEARGSPKLTQLADLTTTAYSSFCSLGFTKPQTELPCSDRALKQPMATLPPVVPHVTTMKNAGIVTTLQKEPDNLMTAPCWGSTNELEVLPPSILLPCLTESTAHDNLAQPRSLTHHEAKSNGGELTPLTTYGEKIVSTNKSCIVIHHPEKKNTIEMQKRKCRTDLGEDQLIEVTEFHNRKKLCSIRYGGGMVQLDPLNQQSMDPTINSGRNGGSGEQRDNVVTHPQEKPKCKHRIQISLEAIQQQRGMSRIDAANCLKVSESTLKRICRKYGIDDWRKIKKDNHSRPIEFVQGVDQEQILKSSSNVPSMQASAIVAHTKLPDTAMQDANMVSIKAKYANDIILKFELSFPYKLVELQQQVAKRLNLEAGTYYIKYKDEDNDLILIACDDDLERLCTCRLRGSSSIQVLKLEVHIAEMSMAPRLKPDAVISTRPEASDRGAFTSIGTTLDSDNLSPAKKARLHELEQKLQRAADSLPVDSLLDRHFPTVQSGDAESCCRARDTCVEEGNTESNSNNYPHYGTTPPPALQIVGEMVQLDSTNQQLMVEGDAINNERNAKEKMKEIEELHSRSQNLPQSMFVDGPLFKEVYRTQSVKPISYVNEFPYGLRTQSVKPISYVNEFPYGLRPFIQHVEDVTADGNCGFRAIAGLLGLGEDNWQQVRSNLITELHMNVTHYQQLFDLRMIDELTQRLSYSESCINIDRWMIMPEMGHLIASCYDVVLYHLSMHQCLTFLPLRSIPIPTPKRREICIGFVKGNHFVKVFLLPGHPVPPIANHWIKFHHPCANGWDNTYIFRIEHFRQIVSSNVATRENIDLVTSSSSSENWHQYLNLSSSKEAPEQSTSSVWSGSWIGRWLNQETDGCNILDVL